MGLICRSISSGGHKCLMPGISLPSQDIRPHGRKSIPHRRPRWTRKDAGFMRVVGGAGRSASGRRKKEQQARIRWKSAPSHKSCALIKGKRGGGGRCVNVRRFTEGNKMQWIIEGMGWLRRLVERELRRKDCREDRGRRGKLRSEFSCFH